MRISNRLEALTFFVPYNSKVIDVGTDHALLPIYLIENDLLCKSYIAMFFFAVSSGPYLLSLAIIGLHTKSFSIK